MEVQECEQGDEIRPSKQWLDSLDSYNPGYRTYFAKDGDVKLRVPALR